MRLQGLRMQVSRSCLRREVRSNAGGNPGNSREALR